MLQIIFLAETRLSSYVYKAVADLQVSSEAWRNMIRMSVLGIYSLFSLKYREQLLIYTLYLLSCLKTAQLLLLAHHKAFCVPWLHGVLIFGA